MNEKKKRNPGGGRKPLPEELKKMFATTSICGTPEEIYKLKEIAKEQNKSLSKLVLDHFLEKDK